MALCRGFLLMLVVLTSCLAVPSLDSGSGLYHMDYWKDFLSWRYSWYLLQFLFNYAGGHTMDEVTESDYKTCTVGSSITTDITLTTPGSHFFICGIMGRCGIGMKLAVNVAAARSAGTGGVSSSQPPLLPSTTLPITFGFGLPLPHLGSGLGQPHLGSGMALPPSSYGFRSMNPSVAGSRNVNSQSLAPSNDLSSTSLPDLSAANAGVGSVFWAVFVAWGSVLVFGMF